MARKHNVKCAICGETFDLNSIQGVKHGARRYAHQTCYPTGEIVPLPDVSKEDSELQELKDFIKDLYGTNANWILIMKQINSFTSEKDNNGKQRYTYSNIKKTLEYFYKVKGNSIESSRGGIGIVPYVYNDAYNYYFDLWLAQQQNKNIDIELYIPQVKEIIIPPPEPTIKKRKLFKFLDEESVE